MEFGNEDVALGVLVSTERRCSWTQLGNACVPFIRSAEYLSFWDISSLPEIAKSDVLLLLFLVHWLARTQLLKDTFSHQ